MLNKILFFNGMPAVLLFKFLHCWFSLIFMVNLIFHAIFDKYLIAVIFDYVLCRLV